nr:serpin family protein [Actinomadura sp. J1-007]
MAQHVLKATGAGHPDREVAREILDVVRRGWPVAPVRPKWHDLATVQTIIAAANALTGRWAAACSGSSTVAAGAGAWPLLALLASAADGPGRDELEKAVGLDAASARDAGLALVDLLDASPAISSALALWMRHDLALDPSWTPPARTRGTLTGDPREDQRRLDAWASERTGGLIPALPIEVTDESRLVLANALTVRTRWFEPFHGDTVLRRSTGHLGLACVAAAPTGAVTMACVAGTDDIDLHLVRGAQSPALSSPPPSGPSTTGTPPSRPPTCPRERPAPASPSATRSRPSPPRRCSSPFRRSRCRRPTTCCPFRTSSASRPSPTRPAATSRGSAPRPSPSARPSRTPWPASTPTASRPRPSPRSPPPPAAPRPPPPTGPAASK